MRYILSTALNGIAVLTEGRTISGVAYFPRWLDVAPEVVAETMADSYGVPLYVVGEGDIATTKSEGHSAIDITVDESGDLLWQPVAA